MADGFRAGAEGIAAAGCVVEGLAGNVAGLGERSEAGGGSGGGGEVGFGRAEVGLGLGDFLRPGAGFSGGEQGAGLGGGGFGLGDFFGSEAAGELCGAGGGFGESGFGLAEAGAEFGEVETDEGSLGVDNGAFFGEYFGDAAADLRADFDAARFDYAIDSRRSHGLVSEPPPGRDGDDRDEKERQTAGDHLPQRIQQALG